MKRALLFITLSLAAGWTAAASDFGLVLSPAGEYVSGPDRKSFDFTGTLTPWFSASPGKTMSLYLSGKFTFEYKSENEAWTEPVLIELDRTELSFRPVQTVYMTLGRQRFRDTGGMILSGLFDGLYSRFGLGGTRLSLGVFYTGFLYKKTAEILMTGEDRERYAAPLDYGDFDTYFASRRILAAAGFEFPDMGSRLSLALDALAQFDVNGETPFHTQYLEANLGVDAADSLRFTLTGIGALAETEGTDFQVNFAAALGADWDVPGALTDMLQAGLRWGSGAVSSRIGPFAPVTSPAQGTVFSAALPGLMNARLSYTALPHGSFSFSMEGAGFWRTDLETFKDAELDSGSKDRFLGTEVSGSLVWAPQSALRLTAGGGVFFPGGAFASSAEMRWKISGAAALSF
jgi:hypothetical protein